MKAKSLIFSIFASLSLTVPAFADNCPIKAGAGSLLGSTTAFIVDVPEGIVVNTLFKCPYKATKSLAKAFGDQEGLTQNLAGAMIGIPSGAVFGVPYGAIVGGKHAMSVGWDKPFSGQSFVVSNEEQ